MQCKANYHATFRGLLIAADRNKSRRRVCSEEPILRRSLSLPIFWLSPEEAHYFWAAAFGILAAPMFHRRRRHPSGR